MFWNELQMQFGSFWREYFKKLAVCLCCYSVKQADAVGCMWPWCDELLAEGKVSFNH